ncbi:unnamed protein product, partial [Phaeothamnion confervicola]
MRISAAYSAGLFLVALACSPAPGAADEVITPFSTALPGTALPPPWRLSLIPNVNRATRFALVADGDVVALRAQAHASMASVLHPLKLDPKALPYLAWRWKISNVLQKSDITSKAGDDFPARVYVLFDYDVSKLSLLQRAKMYLARKRYGDDVPAAALCYVWDRKAPVGTSVWSPYTDRVR